MNSMDPVNKKKKESHYSSFNWSNLPTDLLITVSNKIKDIADFSRFLCVCKSWNLASKKSTFKSPQIPWLLLPYDSSKTIRSFINPSSEAIYNFDIPEACDHAIIGSSNGWLVLINENFNLTILNPVTRVQVEHSIPQLTYFKVKTKVNSPQVLSFIAEGLRCYVYMSPNYPESLGDCVLALSMKDYRLVFFCKIGDKSWKIIRFLGHNICSLAYHKGKIFVVCEGTGFVGVSDPNSDSMVVISMGAGPSDFSYFIKRGNELLLLVDRSRDEDYDYNDLEMKDFEVYKLKDSNDSDNCDDNDGSSDNEDSRNIDTDCEDSDYGSLYSVSDDGDGSDKNYDSDGAFSGDDDCDNDKNYDYVDYSDDDCDNNYIYQSNNTWLEYYEPSDYSIFFTSGVVSTIFCYDPSYLKGKSICYPSKGDSVGYLDDIVVYNLEDQTEKTVACLGDQCFCPYTLKPIWFTPSLY